MSVYAPAHTEANSEQDRIDFFDLLDQTIANDVPIEFRRRLIILGDFNGRVGRNYEDVVGRRWHHQK